MTNKPRANASTGNDFLNDDALAAWLEQEFHVSSAQEAARRIAEIDPVAGRVMVDGAAHPIPRHCYYRQSTQVAVDMIVPNPYQPRMTFDEARLLELANSIRQHGIVQPIILSTNGGKQYILVAGERRWRAARLAGLKTVPAYIRDHDDARTLAILALVENSDREDLNPIEEAQAYRRLVDEFGQSVADIARMRNCHPKTIESRLIWLQLEPEIQALVARGELPCDARVADALLSIPDQVARAKLAKRMARKGIKIKSIVVACEKLVEQLNTRTSGNHAAALRLARKRATREAPPDDTSLSWDSIRSAAGKTCQACEIRATVLRNRAAEPAWILIAHASSDTCRECNVRDVAGACDGCPQVELLRRIIESVEKETVHGACRSA